MIRSRFLFLLLLLIHVGLTPAGIYTCACLVPGESGMAAPTELGQLADQVPAGDTAVTTLLSFLALSFLMAGPLFMVTWFRHTRANLRPYRPPSEFILPPPTPPPHFA